MEKRCLSATKTASGGIANTDIGGSETAKMLGQTTDLPTSSRMRGVRKSVAMTSVGGEEDRMNF